MIILSDDERRKFALWLRQDAESNRGLIEQIGKMPHVASLLNHKRLDVMACLTVASMLESTEEQTISSADVDSP